MTKPVAILVFVYAVTFLQSTFGSFYANLTYSFFGVFIYIRSRSGKGKMIYSTFVGFLLLSILICLSYFDSSQSLKAGMNDFILSVRNFLMILASYSLANYMSKFCKPTVFFRFISILFFMNFIVICLEYFTGIYLLSFFKPIVDTFSAQLAEESGGGRPLGIFLHSNTSSFFSAIYLFYLFLLNRNWFVKSAIVSISLPYLSIAGARTPLITFAICVVFYQCIRLLLGENRTQISRVFVFASLCLFVMASLILCFDFDRVSSVVSNLVLDLVNLLLPAAYGSARVIMSQINDLSAFHSILYSCLLPSSYSVYNNSIEAMGIHGNEVSLRYFLIAYSLPISAVILFWLSRITGIFSLFVVISFLHYHIAFVPLLFLMSILLSRYYFSGLRLDELLDGRRSNILEYMHDRG